MKIKKIFKTLLIVSCASAPASFALSSCSNTIVEYKQEYLSINYYGRDTVYSDKDQPYTLDWTLSGSIYPLATDQGIDWRIINDETSKVRIVNNKLTWPAISTEDVYCFELYACSQKDQSISSTKKFWIDTRSNVVHEEYVAINYNKNTTIYCDKDEQTHTLDWTLSASVYPMECDQNVVWSIKDDETSGKVKIVNNKIQWSKIGTYGTYEFKLCATAKNDSTVSSFLTFCIDTINDGKLSSSDYYDYIAQRTLSVGAIGIDASSGGATLSAASSGTMWFYKRLTDTDHCYEFITNYHVWVGIKNIMDQYNTSTKLHMLAVLGNPDSSNPYSSGYFDYVEVITNFTQEMLNPISINLGTYDESGQTKDLYMDMCAIKVDLQNLYDRSSLENIGGNTKGTNELKNELDYINNHYGKGEQIVNFGSPEANDDVYIAGYPWNNSQQYDDRRQFTYLAQVKTKVEKMQGETLNIFSDSSYYTFQDQCIMTKKETFALGGGASGSMVINEDFQTVGIYWGGTTETTSTSYVFYPKFALFSLDNPTYGTYDFFQTVDQQIN